jgi:hypothetical protein
MAQGTDGGHVPPAVQDIPLELLPSQKTHCSDVNEFALELVVVEVMLVLLLRQLQILVSD